MRYKNHPIIILKAFGVIGMFIFFSFALSFGIIVDGIKEVGVSGVKNTFIDFYNFIISLDLSGANRHILIGVIVAMCWLVFSFFRYFFYWKNSEIILTETHLHSNKIGLFFKNRKQVPLNKIANVNLKRNIFYAVLNIYNVTVDIDSSETANEADYSIVLSGKDAHKLMNDIYRIKGMEKNSFATKHNMKDTLENFSNNLDEEAKYNSIPSSNSNFSYKFTLLDAFIHLILNLSIFNVGFTLIGLYTSMRGSYFVLIIAALSILKYLIGDFDKTFGFRIHREDENIQLSYGLINTNTFTIPLSNIISISTKQSLLARIFRKKCLKLNLIGFANNENETGLISLYMSESNLEKYAKNIIPEFSIFNDNDGELLIKDSYNTDDIVDKTGSYIKDNISINCINVTDNIKNKNIEKTDLEIIKKGRNSTVFIEKPQNSMYYHFVFYSIFLLPLGTIIAIPFNAYWIVGIAFAIIIFLTLNSFYNIRIKITDKSIIAKKGILSKELEIHPYTKIEGIEISQNLLSKRFGLYNLTIYMRGGLLGVGSFSTGLYCIGTFDKIVEYYRNGEK